MESPPTVDLDAARPCRSGRVTQKDLSFDDGNRIRSDDQTGSLFFFTWLRGKARSKRTDIFRCVGGKPGQRQ